MFLNIYKIILKYIFLIFICLSYIYILIENNDQNYILKTIPFLYWKRVIAKCTQQPF
jgi:hypothetical protein